MFIAFLLLSTFSLSLAFRFNMTFRIAKKDRLLVTSVDELANHTFVSLGNDIGALDPLVNLIYKEWDLNKSLINDDKLGLFRVVAKCAVISMLPCYQKLDFISSKTNYNAIKKLRFGISRILRRIRYSYTCVIDLALWTNARLLMLSWPTTQLFSDWKRRLDEFGINIRTYTKEFFQNQNGVYIMIAPTKAHCYIGATSCTLGGRYKSRVRKMRQVSSNKFVECEVAIRFWSSTGTFYDYIPILILATDTKDNAFTMESTIQQRFQPCSSCRGLHNISKQKEVPTT